MGSYDYRVKSDSRVLIFFLIDNLKPRIIAADKRNNIVDKGLFYFFVCLFLFYLIIGDRAIVVFQVCSDIFNRENVFVFLFSYFRFLELQLNKIKSPCVFKRYVATILSMRAYLIFK